MSDLPFTTSEQTFRSDGTMCAARVYRPAADPSATEILRPVIVMGHGFGGVRALRLYAYAERFVAAGYLVVVFDYRGFGESEGSPRQLLDVGMQLQDWRSALSFARVLPGADPERLIAWGTSFGGGHVITLAGRSERLAAIIAQVPHVSGPAAVRATGFGPVTRLVRPAVRDQVAALRRRPPVYVEAVGAPGTTAVMTTPDAVPGLARQMDASGLVEGDYPTYVAARVALKVGLYSPARHASRVSCPALVQIAAHDAVTPRRVAERAAAKMSQSTVHVYDCGHFDPYVEPHFDQVVSDQLAFLRAHVPVSG
ncbi:alpha/beta hydrolase [Nocardioides gilvus]|uniref:alpha/beta hydrolase n=1 Tax=Nocardioides gilvus TaxID=1735589 RepID=UPI001951AA78|nr:alpha/beta fold hydrolase [Nocardioides gilvus]